MVQITDVWQIAEEAEPKNIEEEEVSMVMLIRIFRKLIEKRLLNSSPISYTLSKQIMAKSALVLIAPGSQEIEFVVTVHALVKGNIEVTTAGIPECSLMKCSGGVQIKPDIGVHETKSKGNFDIVILPGGSEGSNAMGESKDVGEILKEQESNGRWIAAICDAPVALASHGIGIGKNITCYPSAWSKMQEKGKYNYVEENVVVDGNIITSQGPGSVFEFAVMIVEQLVGKEKATEVARSLLFSW